MHTQRRTLLRALALLPVAHAARAAGFPTGPVKIIVPGGAGSNPDIQARMIGVELAKGLGQSIVVENVPGAAGILAVQRVTRSAADGHTLLWGFNQLVTMNPNMYTRLPYAADDLLPLGQLGRGGYVLLANKELPVDDVKSLIAYSKANPGKLSYASTGAGSAAHLGIELLRQRFGLDAVHVPYAVGTASTVDLIDGRIHFKLEPPSSGIALLQQGRVKALGVTTPKRFAALPQVPALEESLPGFSITAWVGLFAPKGTPAEVVQKVAAQLSGIVDRPDIRQRFLDMGMVPEWATPEAVTQAIPRETAEWGDVIRKANIKIESK